ncbi:glutamate cyclase domain-containing protein [Paracoccus sp. (in: a-proteobacteria)]|uniref:glutamate cyclase domain-containing protein n=1 Tax=Paracoccus sp. TaxID=267 RepID=UPI0028AB6E02|nr:glutamate cyclase domain-containing protein [Paracoccus sp. (in: a-proteobacteria)]
MTLTTSSTSQAVALALPEALFQSLDDLVNVEFKSKRAMLGGTRLRYDAVRLVAGSPLCLRAAAVLEGLSPKSLVYLTTGAGNPLTLPKGETDGPAGAAVLARYLANLGHPIMLLAESAFLPGIVASFNAYGFMIGADGKGAGIGCEVFPHGAAAGQAKVAELMARYPDAVGGIFIEKPGPNSAGGFHNSAGKPKDPDTVAHLHLLADALNTAGAATLGIGDGGNEIGFGYAETALKAALEVARDCGCPCGGGIANATKVTAFVTAATSNWGAYAVAAALAMLQNRGKDLPSIDLVARSVEASVAGGAHDGYSGLPQSTVDGTELEASVAIYRLCLSLVGHAEKLA